MSVATLPAPETTVNNDGTQTLVFYKVNDAGKKVKVTRRVATELVEADSGAKARRDWAKYGEAAQSQSVQPQIGEEVVLRLFPKTANPKKDSERGEERKPQTKRVSCKYCGGDHLSFQCPLKDKLAMSGDQLPPVPGAPTSRQGSMPPPGVPTPASAMEKGKYVPPSMRGVPGQPMAGKYVPPMRSGAPGVPGSGAHHDEATTLRISNLPENIQDVDLRANFSQFGRLLRCNLVMNRQTGRSRGFAFVVYSTREEADRARRRFDSTPVGNMIMHVDFAQPRE